MKLSKIALIAVAPVLAGGLALASPLAASANHSQGFSSGGKSITVQISCNASQGFVTKLSGSSGVSYAAEVYGGRPGHWVKGNTVTSGTSTATVAQATNWGVYVFGSRHVTGC